jgi:predicted nuclease of predicted toxin-antitoxin system
MRFLVDECAGPAVAKWLRDQGHQVFSVYEEERGMDDDDIVQKAFFENWILITNDKDFGEKIFRERCHHKGVIFLRLRDERGTNKIASLRRLLKGYSNHLEDRFVVVTESQVRFAKSSD